MYINCLWFIEQARETVFKRFTMEICEVIWIFTNDLWKTGSWKGKVYFFVYIKVYINICHLADTFIQSDLQSCMLTFYVWVTPETISSPPLSPQHGHSQSCVHTHTEHYICQMIWKSVEYLLDATPTKILQKYEILCFSICSKRWTSWTFPNQNALSVSTHAKLTHLPPYPHGG